MAALTDLTIAQLSAAMARKDTSAVEVVDAHLKKLDEHRALNAFITETPDKARAMAKASDERRGRGQAGLLEGVPVGIKDLFCTEGVQTTAASHILQGFVPPYESTVTANLWKAGAVMVGKTNLDEFAMGSSNMTSHFGGVENPWKRRGDNRKLVPGGSSGGSAAVVAAHIVPGSTGTDTGGSIRQPASFCGVVGLKPTYGRCSRWGVVAFASSLDQPGPFARTVEDAAIMLQAMSGHDPKDSTSAPLAVPDFVAAARNTDIKGLRIGIPKEYRVDGTAPEIVALWEKGVEMMKGAGASIVEVSLPHTKYALPAYYIVAPAECSSNLARYDGVRFGLRVPGKDLIEMYQNTRGAGFGKEVRRRIMIGTYVLSAGYYDAYYRKAQQIRQLIARDFRQAFEKCDVLLTPTAPTAAFAAGEKMDDPVTMYLNDMFTIPASMAGLPGISVPVGLDKDGLPLGLQLIGRSFDEETMLRSAAALEKAASFTARPVGY
ncbi:MAG TPA: Asp-tRNA(Asn)/Glu-tRNA(Gln) amidotransferase subunit GatA [Reyranella sp.]|jgi:aspartyl-tRNA(Asn)/glutamyl-tRNA(Gln) amidotransferase subunit A|nr:Asp-tRNA(Asn)/Glu-tRNA(Gln) amidotransferase subunit GatA [Reyranella sp.]